MKKYIGIKAIKFFILIIFAVLFLFPTVWMFVSSTKTVAEISKEIGTIQSFIPTFSNISIWLDPYKEMFSRFNFAIHFFNSVFYSFVIVFGSLFVNSLAGYALATFDIPFKKYISGALIILIIFPFQSVLIQIFIIINELNLTNTVWGLALPHIGSAFYIYLFMVFFKGIPKELRESAYIDGASDWQIFTRIAVPISKPIFITIGILVFVGSWNDYVWPLMIFTETSKYPLSVAVNIMNETKPVYLNQVMAGLTVTTIPILLVYILGQKYIMPQNTSSGIK
ncbi:carbohydrate ABC transporter permease [Bacillus sp. HMF5848]|uniref:carbohydrate ABC transporter permease n=1 Tax=Bacillus sp. HMF5848 TaxID=2495421 RepID=UPI000F794964|nr:carbohydrate ABC transporter permease [Bacillus sp. HMF5848]RSK28739.1 carbohydrate ABC transporter permease [Bacillus sp. HMF5848]